MTDYVILYSERPNGLSQQILSRLNEGYKLYGPPFICDKGWYHQAMVK